jgi:hypothetical protein
MELGDALTRLGLSDQSQPTAHIVLAAYDEQMATTSPSGRNDLARQRLAQARDRVLRFSADLSAKERALCERVENMRMLSYDGTDPMSDARAMYYLDLPRETVVGENEILKAWERQMRGTIPRKGGDDPYSQERKLNRARDTILARLKLPEYQAELTRQAEEIELQKQAVLARQAELEKQVELERIFRLQADVDRQAEHELRRCEAAFSGNRAAAPATNLERRISPEIGQQPLRRHNKSSNNMYCVRLIEEMKQAFADQFDKRMGARLSHKEVHAVFTDARSGMSALEENIFKRHSKRLFLEQWTHARSSWFKKQRCFTDVCVRI